MFMLFNSGLFSQVSFSSSCAACHHCTQKSVTRKKKSVYCLEKDKEGNNTHRSVTHAKSPYYSAEDYDRKSLAFYSVVMDTQKNKDKEQDET